MSCGLDFPCPPCDPNKDVNPCTGVKGYGFNSSTEAPGGFQKIKSIKTLFLRILFYVKINQIK